MSVWFSVKGKEAEPSQPKEEPASVCTTRERPGPETHAATTTAFPSLSLSAT
jgi:hypothetical protein